MKIGIITFVKCDNYGAELQAYALQKKLNDLGYDAEVVDMEKERCALEKNFSIYKDAIFNRYKQFGFVGGTRKVIQLVKDKYLSKKAYKKNQEKIRRKHEIFNQFFYKKIRHSEKFYTLEELRNASKLPYDILIAGSDQIWNYKQTNYLDVFFLMMADKWGARKISYAASFSVSSIPKDKKSIYKRYIENMDAISVREINGLDIVKECSDCEATLVLDPTFLLNREEWVLNLAIKDFLPSEKKFVVIYTLSGSHYIYSLAKKIATAYGVEVVNIKSGFAKVDGDDGIMHITDAGPKEFISIFNHAIYVITDSFHGTAFSINFGIPFTVLLNPASTLNSRVLSILKLTNTEDRLIYDDGCDKEPSCLEMDYTNVKRCISELKKTSLDFINNNLEICC